MANKAISELPQAQNVNNQDLFVLEQSGIAKKLTAETFITEQGIIDALAEALDGHGGISSVTLSSVSGRIRTYLITFTDGSATTFQVLDGTSIDRIVKTSTAGLTDTYTVFMNDGTTTFFTVTNGADGTVSEAMLNDALKDKAPAITETTESSAIANFTDGADDMPVVHLTANIEPVQNLPYGDPYPAGGGKQLIPYPYYDSRTSIANVAVTYNSDGSITLNGTASGALFVNLGNGNPAANHITLDAGTYTLSKTGVSGATLVAVKNGNYWFASTATSDATQTLSEQSTVYFYLSAPSGTVFNNAVVYPQCEKGSSATAYAPYSNICPISGWTGCNVTRTGKNLFPIQIEPLRAWATDRQDMVAFMNTLKAGTYTLSCINTILSVRSDPVAAEFLLGVWIRNSAIDYQGPLECRTVITSSQEVAGFSATSTKTITITEAMVGNFNHFYLYSGDNKGNAVSSFDIQLELGSTATTYEPYQGETVTVDWTTEAGTVYGGTIDVATGLLTVDRAMVDLGTEAWAKTTNAIKTYFQTNQEIPDMKKSAGNNIIQPIMCSRYKAASWNHTLDSSGYNCTICGGYKNRSYIVIYDESFVDVSADAFKTAMSGVQLVYELATPQTYQLTPQQLMTLLGTNNVWTDIGNVSVTYPADTKMFIEKLTMPTEDDLVANQAITSGKYFMIGNSLYLALANIASGAQITIGTNAQRVSLADALNTINS